MKKIAVSVFKAHCRALMEQVQASHETVVITKHGKPVAKLVPVNSYAGDTYNFFGGQGAVTGDVVSVGHFPRGMG